MEICLVHNRVTEDPVSLAEIFGSCLYRLSRGDCYHTITEIIGHGSTTARIIKQEFSTVLAIRL